MTAGTCAAGSAVVSKKTSTSLHGGHHRSGCVTDVGDAVARRCRAREKLPAMQHRPRVSRPMQCSRWWSAICARSWNLLVWIDGSTPKCRWRLPTGRREAAEEHVERRASTLRNESPICENAVPGDRSTPHGASHDMSTRTLDGTRIALQGRRSADAHSALATTR